MRQIGAEEMTVGEELFTDVYSQAGVLLARRGRVIDTEQLMDRLLSEGFVFAPPPPPPRPEPDDAQEPDELASGRVRLLELQALHQELESLYAHVTPEAQLPGRVRDVARRVVALCQTDADIALASIFLVLRQPQRHILRHSLNTAIVVNTLLNSSPCDAAERESVTCAALTMNLAITELQERLYSQPAPLTPKQREAVRQHPETGVKLLKLLGVTDETWLRCVLEHHEDLDGNGYPHRRRESELLPGSRLIMFADQYCVRISPRSYREGWTAREAMRSLFLHGGHIVRGEQARQYVKEIGIYPPGSYVRLANGETAVVVRRGQTANCPDVYSVLNASGLPIPEPLRRDTADLRFAIADALSEADAGTTLNPWRL